MRLTLCGLALLCALPAVAGRPPEALLRDREAAEAEVHDLERRAHALDEAQTRRKSELKSRLRAIYKLSSGGLFQVLLGSESAADFDLRRAAMRRLLARDLDELAQVRDDSRELDEAQARRAASLARAIELGQSLASVEGAGASLEPTGLLTQKGRLARPVPGPIVASFGSYRQPVPGVRAPQAIVLSRRGAILRARAGEKVVSIAAGQVRFVGDIPGHGTGVAIDHGDGYLSITGGLTQIAVGKGQSIAGGAPLGDAAGPTIYMELAQGGTPLDPSSWLTRPKRP